VLSRSTELTIRDFCFDGVAAVVPVGSTITVTNEGQTTHNIVSVDRRFSSPDLFHGDRYQFTVDAPGVYAYYCSFHGTAEGRGMAGVLVVEDGASLAAARSDTGNVVAAAPAAATAATAATATKQPGSAWGWVALGALLLAGAALCVSLAVVRPRQT
jgi:hypothetical protein